MTGFMIIALLVLVTVAPLLLLGLFVLADRLGLTIAARILDWTATALAVQWRLGSVINIVGGVAVAAGGVYCALALENPTRWIAPVVLIPFGIWRVRRGLVAWSVSASFVDELGTARSQERL